MCCRIVALLGLVAEMDSGYRELALAIDEQRIVILAGAGLTISATCGAPTASWIGLLEGAVARCRDLALIDSTAEETLVTRLRSAEPAELARVAQQLVDIMGGPTSPGFQLWLQDSVGSLKIRDDSLARIIPSLRAPIVTTNYDDVLSVVTGWRPYTWKDRAAAIDVLNRRMPGVVHIHGHWRRPDTIILGTESYSGILSDEFAQAVLRSVHGLQSVLFVGCGQGLVDPNFAHLVRWFKRAFAETRHRHFQLVRDRDAPCDASFVYPIVFGKDFEDLPHFLWTLRRGCIRHSSARGLRNEVAAQPVLPIDRFRYYAIEWLICAALDNGVFEPGAVRRRVDPSDADDVIVAAAYDELRSRGVIKEKAVEQAYLADIDDVVVPYLHSRYGLSLAAILSARACLKQLAHDKVTTDGWEFSPDGVLYTHPIRAPEHIKHDTLRLVESSLDIYVITEYGTWLRRPPFRKAIEELVARGGQVTAVIALPPPVDSEGFLEWTDSVGVLLEMGVRLLVADSADHSLHCTLGDREAISLSRRATSYDIKTVRLTDESDLAVLRKKLNETVRASSTKTIDAVFATMTPQRRGPGFTVLAHGEWPSHDVKARVTDERVSEYSGHVATFVADAWHAARTAAERDRVRLHDAELVCLKVVRSDRECLSLELGLTSYKAFVARMHALREVPIDRELQERLLPPLAVCAAVVTSDRKVLVGRRSRRTATHAGCLHVPGGHIERCQGDTEGVNVHQAILNELHEELAIGEEHVACVSCLGVVSDSLWQKPEVVFEVNLNIEHGDISQPADYEHSCVEWHDCDAETIAGLLVHRATEFVPVGRACLMMYGAHKFGYEWWIHTRESIGRSVLSARVGGGSTASA